MIDSPLYLSGVVRWNDELVAHRSKLKVMQNFNVLIINIMNL